MSVLDRSCFSYQVAAGSRMSPNSPDEVIRKSMLTSRSSLPTASSSRHVTWSERSVVSSARTALLVPSRCLRKYSLPLLEDPSRFARHRVSTRGQFSGASGSSIANLRSPDSSCCLTYSGGSIPAARASRTISIGFRLKLGTDGIHPERADCAIVSIMDRFSKRPSPSGVASRPAPRLSYRHWSVLTYQNAVPIICRAGRCQSSANARFAQPVIGRTFSCPT